MAAAVLGMAPTATWASASAPTHGDPSSLSAPLPGWPGALAVDETTNQAYAISGSPSTVSAISLASGKVLRSEQMRHRDFELVQAHLTRAGGSFLRAIQSVTTVPGTRYGAYGMAVEPSGKGVYITGLNSSGTGYNILTVDGRRSSLTSQTQAIPHTSILEEPVNLAIAPQGDHVLYMTLRNVVKGKPTGSFRAVRLHASG